MDMQLDRDIWKVITKGIELERIKRLPVADKFLLVEYLKHLRREADWALEHGQENLDQSPNYTLGQSYRLLATLIHHQVPADEMRAVVWNYLDNFEGSDSYYTKFALLAMGMLMIRKGISGDVIFHTLLGTLGDDFLTNNLKFHGYQQALATEPNFPTTIRYKEYEKKYRRMKYDLLALNLMYKHDGLEPVEQYIMEHQDDQVLKLYFQMIKHNQGNFRRELVKMLISDDKDYNQMVVTGIISMFLKRSIMLSHYMMNSVIGKYDHYDQRPQRVETEVQERYLELKQSL